jgi:hypothetical protein
MLLVIDFPGVFDLKASAGINHYARDTPRPFVIIQ